MRAHTFPNPPFPDHALLDSGGAEKLERFGEVVLRRPDPQAFWSKRLPESEWKRADLTFVRESDRGGRWEVGEKAPRAALGSSPAWHVRFGAGVFEIQPTPFKHVGLFPEQAANWLHVSAVARNFGVERPRLLNLFAYTGAASVFAAQAGYEVTHVDASKTSLAWAKRNVELSKLPNDSLRFVLDDALGYARREVRRGARYNVVLLDPPSFGRGPNGEKWEFEDGIAPLVDAVKALVAERALVVLSTYAIGCSPLTFENLLAELGEGAIESGELALPEESRSRLLPCGFCARWSRGIDVPSV